MKEIDYYKLAEHRLTDRHRQDDVFKAILFTLIDVKVKRQEEYIDFANTFLDIDKCSGTALDMIGAFLGEPRELVDFMEEPYFGFQGAPNAKAYNEGYWYSLYQNREASFKTLEDELYRRVLKARIIKDSSGANRDSLIRVLNTLTGNDSTIIDENPLADVRHGVIKVKIRDEDSLASYYLTNYKKDKNLIPIPLGFRLIVERI